MWDVFFFLFQDHSITDSQAVNMPRAKPKYMSDGIQTEAAIAKVQFLRAQIYGASGTLLGAKSTLLLQLLRSSGVDTSQLQTDLDCPLTARPFLKGQ